MESRPAVQDTQVRRLPSGLTVLVREDRSAPVVAIVTHVGAGYFDEADDVVGISHVLEHMFFKGTARRGPGELARETKSAGGYLNAGTIYDRTSYYTVLPASSLAAGLDIQADALLHSTIDAEELRKELLVIIQEARRKRDNPAAVAQESLFELLWDRHRMRRWRIGTEEALAGYTREDVLGFYRTYYRPSRIVLSIVGDVDAARAFEQVERTHAGLDAAPVPARPVEVEPPLESFRFRELEGDVVQSSLEWGWRTRGTLHEDTPALDLLAVILGQGRASRLYRQVREPGLVHAVSAYNYTPTDVGVFGISAELDAPRALEAMRAMAAVVAGAAAEPPTPEEMSRARQSFEARLLRRAETMEGQATLLAEWQSLGGWRLSEEYVERVLSLDAASVAAAAARYLDIDRAAALLYRPRAAPGLGMDARALAGALHERAPVGPPPPAVEPPAAAPPPAGAAPVLERVEDGVHFYRLAGGLNVVVLRRGSAPLVSLCFSVHGGSLDETPSCAGITSLMARTSIKGTARYSAARLAMESETLGGSIAPLAGADLVEWDLTLPVSRLGRGMELLAEAALRPRFPAAELERERAALLSDLDQMRDDMYRFPLRLFFENAFGGHPYGFGLDVIEAAVAGLGRDDVAAWHERVVRGGSPWLFVVGNVEPDEAARAAALAFGDVQAAGAANGAGAPRWPVGRPALVVTREKKQTALVLGFPGPPRDDDDAFALQIMAGAVSGLGGRLFEELRSRRSLAYTVAAYPVSRRLAGAFLAYIATAPEREEEARTGLLDQLRALTDGLLPEEDVERARRYAIGSRQIRLQTNAAALGELVHAVLIGRGVRELREHDERIRAVTATRIRDAAARWMEPDRLIEAVVRGTGA
jgi:zinc protease